MTLTPLRKRIEKGLQLRDDVFVIGFAMFLVRDVLEGAGKPKRILVKLDRGSPNDDVSVLAVAAREFKFDSECQALGNGLIKRDLKALVLDVTQGAHERAGGIERSADDRSQKIQRSFGQRH